MVSEQTKLDKRLSWLISSMPSLIIAILLGVFSTTTLSKLSTVAGGIQVLTSAAIVISFIISRKKAEKEDGFDMRQTITGVFGQTVFGILVILSSLIATIGSIVY